MEKLHWNNQLWWKRFDWGYFHPDAKHNWYDPDAIEVIEDELYLVVSNNGFTKPDGEVLPYGIGLVVSEQTYSYGTFEAEIQLPYGENLFPAFWITGADSWPPEIDIFEFWTHKEWWDPFWLQRRWMKSGLYSCKDGEVVGVPKSLLFNHSKLNKKNGFTLLPKNIHERFYNYKLVWEPTSAKFYFNNRLVWEADSRIKDPCFSSYPKMRVVFNNGVARRRPKLYEPMIVKNFKYTPLLYSLN